MHLLKIIIGFFKRKEKPAPISQESWEESYRKKMKGVRDASIEREKLNKKK